MFEFIRTHKKWMQVFLALLIIPSFVVVGVSSYGGGAGAGAEEVANVGGLKITRQEWEDAQRRQQDIARNAEGKNFDPKKFETPQAKQEVLDSLIAQRALDAEIRTSSMTVSDGVVMKEIQKNPMFQKPDGSFDLEGYKQILKMQNMRADQYQESIRRDLALQQLSTAVGSSAFAPRTVATRVSDILEGEREVQEMMFPIAEYLPKAQVTPEMIKAYYDKNATLFQIPERVKAEYVVFDAASVEKQVTVDDAEVAKFYTDNEKRFTTPEERAASHILFTAPAGDAAKKAAAKAKADATLAEVRAAPASFAAVAKERSEDAASKEQGGDLGDAKSLGVPELLAAIQKLKQGDMAVVESSFGYHVLHMTRVTPATIKPLEEVKPMIAAELKKQKMSKKYSELAETFNNTVDELNDSLKPAADKLGLTVQLADNLTRTPSPAAGDAPYNNAKFLAALFTADSIKNKRNIEAVEVAPSVLVAGRVLEHKPAATRPLADVEPVIRMRVMQIEAMALAKKAGEAKMAAAKAAGDAAGFSDVKVVSRSKPPGIPEVAAQAVLKADATTLPAYVGVDVPGMGYGVYRIGKVAQPAQADPARRKALQDQISGVLARQEIAIYLESLKLKAKSKVTAPVTTVADAK